MLRFGRFHKRKPFASIFGNMLQFGTKVWDIFATQFECSHLALDEIAFGLRPKEIFLIFEITEYKLFGFWLLPSPR